MFGIVSAVRPSLPFRGLAQPDSHFILTILNLGTSVNWNQLSEKLNLECSQAFGLIGNCVEILVSSRGFMRESQTCCGCGNRLLTGAIGVQDMYKRHFACLTFYAQNSHRLAIIAAFHHNRHKSTPGTFLMCPLLTSIFRQGPHWIMFGVINLSACRNLLSVRPDCRTGSGNTAQPERCTNEGEPREVSDAFRHTMLDKCQYHIPDSPACSFLGAKSWPVGSE